jgi:hypothetical protein
MRPAFVELLDKPVLDVYDTVADEVPVQLAASQGILLSKSTSSKPLYLYDHKLCEAESSSKTCHCSLTYFDRYAIITILVSP